MQNQEFKEWIQLLINDSKVKSIEITRWEEFGEFSGEILKPIFKIEKFQTELINKPVETTNEQPKCKIPHKGRKWCSVYKGICKCYSKKG